ncbi:FMNL2 family protein [Megaselia abdita]
MGAVKSRPLPQTDSLSDENVSGEGSSTLTTKPITRSLGRPRHEIFPHQSLYRGSSIRSRHHQPPMPDLNEIDSRFAKVLASMDLPPDKAKLLRNYDNEKKWDIICDQEMVHAKDPPSHYLTKLRTYLDPTASRSHRKRKIVGESTSTQVLRDLEISLRTNHIEWVKEFLDESNEGLDALVDYLSFRLLMMRHEQLQDVQENSLDGINEGGEISLQHNTTTNTTNSISSPCANNNDSKSNYSANNSGFMRPSLADILDSPSVKRRSRHIAKLNMGASTDDIHVCIMCLRAIMNNKYGFNMVIQHREAINCIALSLIHKSLRTKALVLELLAAICLVKGGHEIILSAFDNFKEVCKETRRFQTLMEYFMTYETFNIDFMVACMQFVNIVVHSVEDMNYRVHLQYEFTALGLDKYLEKLKLTESEELQVQISAYLDNVFDVTALMEDSETKTTALERVQELEDDFARLAERHNEVLCKLAETESDYNILKAERDDLVHTKRAADEEVTTLRKVLKQNEQELKNRESMLESKSLELENLTRSLPRSGSNHSSVSVQISNGQSSDSSVCVPPPPPPPMIAVPPPPAPPPPPMMNNGFHSFKSIQDSANNNHPPKAPPMLSSFAPPPPPVAGFMPAPDGAMTIKRKVQTKYKLPTLNWIALKPNQVRGTIFNELDDEKIHKHIDFIDFEERFKVGIGGPIMNGKDDADGLQSFPSKRFKKMESVSLLENTRLRNIAISRRKLDMPIDEVIAAINSLDLKKLSLENVELLQKMVPTDVETKAYKDFIAERKDQNQLTDEDKFMLQLATRVDRTSSKLSIMNFMGNFFDSMHLICPQIYALMTASNSLKQSRKFKQVLEIVLAFGNYLNSSKRGPAYGFKLQSLDTLLDTKSTDKRQSLLHYIVATIRQKFPDILNFDSELYCTDKAAQVSLENIIADVHELEKGMEQVRKEADLRSKGSQIHILRDFLNNTEEKLKKAKVDLKNAQDAFKECVEYFGESSRNADASAFFSLIVRFSRAFKQHDQENEQRRRLEQAAADKKVNADVILRNKVNQKKQQKFGCVTSENTLIHRSLTNMV